MKTSIVAVAAMCSWANLAHKTYAQATVSGCTGSREFTIVNEFLSFAQAKAACVSRGMTLGGITSLEENNFVFALADGFFGLEGADIWIGNAKI